jgi:tetratricopeptide (TPR) repeat protein
VARDSADFVAWFGLGECQFRDATVLQDPASASGWRFRSSYDAASTAYRRGLAAAPFLSGAVSERLQRILITEPGRFRLGAALPPDTGGFWAYPSLAGDTLGFVPYRAAAVASGTVEDPPTLSAALAHGRLLLSEIARSWVEAYPRSAAALMAGAANYEELARSGGGALDVRRALELVRQARALDPPSLTRVVLAHMEARLLLKLEQFDEVQRLADSALRAVTDPDPRVARRLAALAMLLGRPHEAVRLLEAGAQFAEPVAGLRDVPLPMLIARERLMGYAAIGESGDSVRRLIGVLDSLVGAWDGDASDARRQAVLEEPLAAAFPSHGRGSAHRPDASSHVVRLQARLAAGDAAGVRAGLDTLEAVRRGLRAQDVSMGVYYQEAWLRLQVGDTATTVALLDRMLSDFPALSTRALADVVDVAALVRIMALRAQLEAPGGAVGRRWAGAVATLWRGAEPELLPVVRAMRALAG